MVDSDKSRTKCKPAGTILDGKYLIVSEIGQGLMGVVYRATHQLMARSVAIKMLQAELASDPGNRLRFQQEARAVSMLNHPGIVTVHDFGLSPEGEPYLVMDLIQGRSLADELKEVGQLGPARTVTVAIELCDALSHAHRKAVLHRDIKPSNIFLVADAENRRLTKLLDFGIARLLQEDSKFQQRLTQPGQVFANPQYMSPEQCFGREVDARSDIYSLGCVLYQALSGQAPFAGSTTLEIVSQQMVQDPPSLRSTVGGRAVLPSLESVIMKALEKDPARRFQSMEQMRQALEQAGQAIDSAPLPSQPAEPSGVSSHPVGLSNPLFWRTALSVLLIISALAAVWNWWPQGRLALAKVQLLWQETTLPVNDPTLLASTDRVATLYREQSNYKSACELYEKALLLARHKYGSLSQQVAQRLSDLGDLYNRENDHSHMAERHYQEALTSFEKLATQAESVKQQNASIFYCEKQLQLTEKLFEPASFEVGAKLFDLAVKYDHAGATRKAEDYYKKALAIAEKHEDQDSEIRQRCLHYLGRLWMNEHRFPEAEGMLAKALPLILDRSGLTDPYALEVLDCLATVYNQEGKWSEVIGLIEPAQKALKQVRGEDNFNSAYLSQQLGYAYSQVGKANQAEATYKASIEGYAALDMSGYQGIACYWLALLYAKQGRDVEAEQMYKIAAKLLDQGQRPIEDKAGLLSSYSTLLRKLGRIAEADRLLQKSKLLGSQVKK